MPRFHERLGIWRPNLGTAWLPDLANAEEEAWRDRGMAIALRSWREKGPALWSLAPCLSTRHNRPLVLFAFLSPFPGPQKRGPPELQRCLTFFLGQERSQPKGKGKARMSVRACDHTGARRKSNYVCSILKKKMSKTLFFPKEIFPQICSAKALFVKEW